MASQGLKGLTRRMLTAALVTVALASVATSVTAPAEADPAPPTSVSDAVKQLNELNSQAEALTEAWHAAQDQFAARQADIPKAQAAAVAARNAVGVAQARQEQFHQQVDQLTSASFQGAQVNALSALLTSASPRDYLDKVSALDLVAADNRQALDQYSAATTQAEQAQRAAGDAIADAQRLAAEADRAAQDAAARKQDADRQIAVVKQRLAALSGADRRSYTSPGATNFPTDVPGTGVGATALRAALTQQGKPYVWGAEGPDSYDCSGLMQWAFKQAGVSLPRSSREQATVGTPVSRAALQPGDLVFFYSPVHHVAIYVGNGLMLHAPQSGDVVKVAPLDTGNFNTARRL